MIRTLVMTLAALTFATPALAQSPVVTATPTASGTLRRDVLMDAHRDAQLALRLARKALAENPDNHDEIERRLTELEEAIKRLEEAIEHLEEGHDLQSTLIAELQADVAILKAQAERMESRVLELERFRASSVLGANCSLGFHAPIPGIAPGVGVGCGLLGGIDVGNSDGGWMLWANPELTLYPLGAYSLSGYGVRYWRNPKGNVEYGFVLGGGAQFFEALPGPKYSAFEGGLHAGGYGAMRLWQRREKGTSTWIGLVPVVEAGYVGTATAGAPQANAKLKLVVFGRKRFNVPYEDAHPELFETADDATEEGAEAEPEAPAAEAEDADGAAMAEDYLIEDLDAEPTPAQLREQRRAERQAPEVADGELVTREGPDELSDIDWDQLPEEL